MLLLIGEGPDEEIIKQRVEELKLNNNVVFLGRRNDVPKLFQAMDCFVLPSRFEGLPIVGIEAQAAGLPCIFSDAITLETAIISNTVFIPLNNINDWVIKLFEFYNSKNERDVKTQIDNAGYNIKSEIKQLEKFYITI